MAKEWVKHEISQALLTVHKRKIEDERQESKAQTEHERVAVAVYKNIGEFIDGLRSHPEYLTKDGIGGRDVTIKTGVPNQWGGIVRHGC